MSANTKLSKEGRSEFSIIQGQSCPDTFSVPPAEGDPSSFSHCLKIITTNDPEAVEKLEHLRTVHGLPQRAGFSYLKPVGSLQSCGCGVEFDSFTYIKNNAVNMELLNSVCKNLDRGKCPHVVELVPNEHDEGWQRYTSTTLLQVAAASGNMQVIEYLRAISIDSLLSTSRASLMPFHPVVIESHVFQHVHDEVVALIETPNGVMKEMQRCLKIGRLPESACFGQDMAYIAASLLMTFVIPDRRSARLLINTLGIRIPFLHIFVYLVMNKTSGVAVQELVVRNLISKISDMSQRRQLIVATILADDENVLQYLICEIGIGKPTNHGNYAFSGAVHPHSIRRSRSTIDNSSGHKYNELDVAIAFGSTRCAAVLQSHMNPTPNVYRQLSPYNFLIRTAEHFPENIDYLGILKKLSEQGFDAKFLDEELNCSPLAVAVLLCRGIFIKPLIEFGFDINNTYQGNLIQLLFNPHAAISRRTLVEFLSIPLGGEIRTGQFETLKSILYQNLTPDRCSLHFAVSYDLQTGQILNIMSEKVIKFTSDTVRDVNDVIVISPKDRFLALSAYAVLFELGFSTNVSNCEELVHSHMSMEERRLIRRGDPEYAQEQINKYKAYLECILYARSQPRSLQSCCRISIRKACPGHRLHMFLSTARMPRSLIDFILNPHMLWKTVID